MKNELVSIITPSYNSAEFITETIESILAQTYENWELLITDDCSTDNSVQVIEQYIEKDPRIKLFRLDKNSGAGVCRNRSITEAKGRFIAFCDSDDCWLPQKLERQISFMMEHDYAFSYSSYMECDESGHIQGIVVCKKKETFSSLKACNGIGCLTAVYDTKHVEKTLMPKIRKRQDWGLWLKILSKCKVAYGLKEPLALYRVRSNSISRNKVGLIKHNLKMYREVLGFSAIKAFLYFCFINMPVFFMKKLGLRYINR